MDGANALCCGTIFLNSTATPFARSSEIILHFRDKFIIVAYIRYILSIQQFKLSVTTLFSLEKTTIPETSSNFNSWIYEVSKS